MRRNFLHIIGALLIMATVLVACSKKEVGPTLIVHVEEADGTPVVGVSVRAWHGEIDSLGGSGILNEEDFDKTAVTDNVGDAIFEFKASAVLDVDVIYLKEGFDTLVPPNPIIDTLKGHKVVKIEAVRQRSEQNVFNETVVVK